MSPAALSRLQPRTFAAFSAVMAIVRPTVSFMRSYWKTGRDARALQALPDHVLADMGLEKFNVLTGTNGNRDVWIAPHRYR